MKSYCISIEEDTRYNARKLIMFIWEAVVVVTLQSNRQAHPLIDTLN